MHILTTVAIIALFSASTRCLLLASFTADHYLNKQHVNGSHAFDLIHSFIQSIHVVEYLALLYGIGGFYLYAMLKRKELHKLNITYRESCKWRFGCSCVGVMVLCGLGLMILAVSTFTPVGVLTYRPTDIISANVTGLDLTDVYVGISYISHICHSLTRIFMIYVTLVAKFAWHYHTHSEAGESSSYIACAKIILRPKWLEDKLENDGTKDPKEKFTALINNYNEIGQFVTPLYGIFQQWFVMQWVVYFIKIIEDFAIILHSLDIDDHSYAYEQKMHELVFILTHLAYDVILVIIPYYCASVLNQYHQDYHDRIQRIQKEIFCNDPDSWRLQSALLIPQNPKFIFVPSFCGLSIPLSNPGYNLSIIITLFAFIISFSTTIH